jgi:hypothetical protein
MNEMSVFLIVLSAPDEDTKGGEDKALLKTRVIDIPRDYK